MNEDRPIEALPDRSGHRTDQGATPAAVARYYETGQWRRVNVARHLHDAAGSWPDRVAVASYAPRTSEAPWQELTYRELAALANRVTAALIAVGVGVGDRVFVASANRVEAAALYFGVAQAGAVYVNVPQTYGAREVGYIIAKTRPTVVVLDGDLGSERAAQYLTACAEVGSVGRVVVTPSTTGAPPIAGLVPFEDFLAQGDGAGAPAGPVVDAGLVQIGFTSGTTGFPKGVMNAHQTFDFLTRSLVEHLGREAFGSPPVNLVASPVGHLTGLLWGIGLTAYLGGTAILQSRWDPAVAVDLIRRREVTTMFGAPTFLRDVLEAVRADGGGLDPLRLFMVAGAPIPRPLARQAAEDLGAFMCPAWGMTEHAIGVAGSPSMGQERCLSTDGRPLADCEIRIGEGPVGPEGRHVGPLALRSPGLFLGYYEEPELTAAAISSDGWLDTGDLASVDEDGFVRLEGRTKDIIIRGGMNIPVTEVENLVAEHPDVLEVAVVGMPDERLGERARAFLVLRPGATIDLGQLGRFLLDRGLSKHYLPESVECRDALPKTPSGKIRKVELKETVA